MSDTDDGFDEEAVRRELREKYENDDRGETERMSELLLQGATMTNQHCDHCGTPIFRYDGQAFCPNCQHEHEQQQQAQAQGDETAQAQGGQEAQAQSDQTGRAAGGQTHGRTQPPQSDDGTGAADATQAGTETPQSRASPERSQPAAQPQHNDLPQTTPGASGEAADALESSIAALARRAAGSDDPRTAREYLEAAREAAEALAALHRTD